jgi:dephospho-CoA kinase
LHDSRRTNAAIILGMTKIRNRRLGFLAGFAVVAVGAWWTAKDDAPSAWFAKAVGGKPAQTAAAAKPICASPVNPNVAAPVDCIPAQFANLPPDPGEAAKATIDGVDADKDGMRDDVQRWIALEWGHSPIAMRRATMVAQQYLRAVHYGDSLGNEKTREMFGAKLMREAACAFGLETSETQERGTRRQLRLLVLNTPERVQRASDFDMMFAHTDMPMYEGTASEACGFDIEALAALEGKRTIASQLRAESIERTKQERLAELERLKKEDPERAREFAWENEFVYGINEGASK